MASAKGINNLLAASAVLMLTTGCASYEPAALPKLQEDFAPYATSVDGVTVAIKRFDSADSKRYLDRDVISKGFQPLQITVINDSDRYLVFSPDGVTLPLVPAEDVAEKVHTSTVGRAAGYGAAGLILWPLLIPAVVDGVGSSNANAALDRDFSAKAASQVVVQPYSSHNGLLFVPIEHYSDAFDVTLLDRANKKKLQFQVRL